MTPRPRVFISSVMRDYESFRDAASQGIQSAGCEPFRAEDFPAGSVPPRTACLDGVLSSDALVLILGKRYGFVGPSGLSATEEEYEEARRGHKPTLVFIQDGVSHGSRQRRFVEKVSDYVDGHWRKTFRDTEELAELVWRAVVAADLAGLPIQGKKADYRINAALDRRLPQVSGVVWLQVIWATLRDEEVFDPLDLDENRFKRGILRSAHECEPPLFSYEESKQTILKVSLLRIEQGNAHAGHQARQRVIVEIQTDGTLSVAQNVTNFEARGNPTDVVHRMYYLNPTALRERIGRAWSFAAAWWNDHDPYRRHDPLLYTVALRDVGQRTLLPPSSRSGFGGIPIPPECPENPLVVFDRPRRVSRADFDEVAHEIERTTKMLERRFRQWGNQWAGTSLHWVHTEQR